MGCPSSLTADGFLKLCLPYVTRKFFAMNQGRENLTILLNLGTHHS